MYYIDKGLGNLVIKHYNRYMPEDRGLRLHANKRKKKDRPTEAGNYKTVSDMQGLVTKLETLANQNSSCKQHSEVLKLSLSAKDQCSTKRGGEGVSSDQEYLIILCGKCEDVFLFKKAANNLVIKHSNLYMFWTYIRNVHS